MGKPYEINIICEPSEESRSKCLKSALRKRANSSSLGDLLRISYTDVTVPKSAAQDSIVRLAVHLASAKKPSRKVRNLIEDWLAVNVLVIPVVQKHRQVPNVTHDRITSVNACEWDRGDNEPPASVVTDLFSAIGLTDEDRRVFISYKRSDSQGVANQLFHALSQRNYQVFLDWVSIDGGKYFQQELMLRLANIAMVVFLESPNVKQSPWVMSEIQFAQRHKLGLLAISWREICSDRRLQVNEIPAGYRHCPGDIGDTLTDKQLKDAIGQIENAHAEAMARRKKELLGSIVQLANEHQISYRWAGVWSLVMKTSLSRQSVWWDVVPRPARGEDLFDQNRRRMQTTDANGLACSLVAYHGFNVLSDHHLYLDWVANGNAVVPVLDSEIRDVLSKLARS